MAAAGDANPNPNPRLLRWQLVREREREEELARSREPSIPQANPAADHGAQRVPDRVEDPLCEVLGRVGPQLLTPLRPMQTRGEPPCEVAAPIVEGRAHERNERGARERRPEEHKRWHRRPGEQRACRWLAPRRASKTCNGVQKRTYPQPTTRTKYTWGKQCTPRDLRRRPRQRRPCYARPRSRRPAPRAYLSPRSWSPCPPPSTRPS